MPVALIGDLDTDFVKERHIQDRIGFLQLVYKRTMLASEFLANPPAVQEFRESVVHVRSEVEVSDGVAMVRHFYEGLPPDHRVDIKVYEFDPSFDEVPIQAHPNFGGPDGDSNSLFKKYGGYYDANGNFRFATRQPQGGDTRGGFGVAPLSQGSTPVGGAGEVKTLQGVESYMRMGGVWRVIYPYAGQNLPNGLFRKVGTVQEPLDSDRIPGLPSKRNWLKGPPSARWRGNAWEITEEYILSGVGGWVRDIYDGSTEG
jgi:hypothetical protein